MKNTVNLARLFLLILLNFFTLVACLHYFNKNSKAVNNDFDVTITSDKDTVQPRDEFSIKIEIKNTSLNTINNLEIRVPFIKTIKDTEYQLESPAFNRILDTFEYPNGFNSRSWIINFLNQNESKSFLLKYKVVDDPKTPDGLISSFKLPVSWVDPAGAPSNTQLDVKTFRADIYVNKIYSTSFTLDLPKLESLDNPVALVSLNKKYLYPGNKTTNLKSITKSNINSFPNFTLDSSEVTIEWLNPIDFSGSNTANQLNNLDDYLSTSWGKINFDPAKLPFLANKPVRVIFKEQNFVNPPKIKLMKDVITLTEAKATLNKSDKTVTIELPELKNVAVFPSIEIENPIIETDVPDVEIMGKVSDPYSNVTYSIDGSTAQSVPSIDLSNGTFLFKIAVKNPTTRAEIKNILKNNEEESKIVIIKLRQDITSQNSDENTIPSTISLPLNQITIALLLSAFGLLAIIFGVVYYLITRRNNNKDKSTEINLNPVVNKVSSIGTSDQQDFKKEKIDLTELRRKYEINSDSKQEDETKKES